LSLISGSIVDGQPFTASNERPIIIMQLFGKFWL